MTDNSNIDLKTGYKLLGQRLIRRSVNHWLWLTAMLMLICGLILAGALKAEIVGWPGLTGIALLALLCLILAGWRILRTRQNLLDELTEVDARFEFRERLSTAYELEKSGKESVFKKPLLAEAGKILNKFPAERLIPHRVGLPVFAAPILALVLLFVLAFDFSSLAPKQSPEAKAAMTRLSRQFEIFSKSEKKELKKPEKRNSRPNIFKQMEKLSKRMKTEPMTKKKTLKSIGEIMEQAARSRSNLARRMDSELNPGGIKGVPTFKPFEEKSPTKEQMDKLQQRLKQMFSDKIPLTLQQDLERLAQAARIEKFLDEANKEANALIPGRDDESDKKQQAKFQGGPGQGKDEGKEPGNGSTPSDKEAIDGMPETPDDVPGNVPDQMQGGYNPDLEDNFRYVAGKGVDRDKKKDPEKIETSKKTSSPDKGESGEGKRFILQVRSLPAVKNATVKEADVLKSYQNQLEEILKKEEIPIAYRNQVKKYFLSIGLREEENGK